MLGYLCTQPVYAVADGTSAAPQAPAVPGLLDGLGLSSLWRAPTPAYQGQGSPTATAAAPGLLCWLVGDPTPAYQTALAEKPVKPPTPTTPPGPAQTARGWHDER